MNDRYRMAREMEAAYDADPEGFAAEMLEAWENAAPSKVKVGRLTPESVDAFIARQDERFGATDGG
jgi:hypothetical protein